jgi:bacillithiol biosynthesis deacetylase BshB1
MKLDILAFGAHPDDIELSCSGTLLRSIAQGKKVGLIDLTRGELGTRGTPEIRDQEAADASKKMGAAIRGNLRMADGFFTQDKESIQQIIEIVRMFKPEIVLANAVNDRHIDHGRAAKLVADACFLSGLSKIESEWDGTPQEAWRPKNVYHYIQDYNLTPDFVVDISEYMDQKVELIKCFKSQFFDPNSTEPATPISSKEFFEYVIARARVQGRHAGFEFGEGFTVAHTIGIKDLFHLT